MRGRRALDGMGCTEESEVINVPVIASPKTSRDAKPGFRATKSVSEEIGYAQLLVRERQ